MLFALKSTGFSGVSDWTGHAASWPKSVCLYTVGRLFKSSMVYMPSSLS